MSGHWARLDDSPWLAPEDPWFRRAFVGDNRHAEHAPDAPTSASTLLTALLDDAEPADADEVDDEETPVRTSTVDLAAILRRTMRPYRSRATREALWASARAQARRAD